MTVKNKHDLIMEAAVQVLSQKGYHNTKMEEIALAAGIGKGTIYEYFSSKLQLLQEIMERSFKLYYNCLDKAENQDLSLQSRLRVLVEGHLRFCRENKYLTRILFFDTDIIDNELRDWADRNRRQKKEHLEKLLAAAAEKGEIRAVDPTILCMMIQGIFSSFWLPIIEGWEFDASVAADQITDILMHGILKENSITAQPMQ